MDFWDRLEKRINEKSNRKEVMAIAGVAVNSPSTWRKRKTIPSGDVLTKIAVFLDTTVEELVDGESGRVYALEWAERNGAKWRPPERIAALIEDLNAMNDKDLETMLVTASVIKAKRLSETAASAS
jgi:transcriptional regulator with XRE-family HTH domain